MHTGVTTFTSVLNMYKKLLKQMIHWEDCLVREMRQETKFSDTYERIIPERVAPYTVLQMS